MRCLLEYHIIKMSLYQSVPQFPLLGQMPAQMYTRMCLHDYFSFNTVFPAELGPIILIRYIGSLPAIEIISL